MAHHPHRQRRFNVHDGSHGITKLKPKIRIVHVFAPEIIKIDAADFRELVQRLTGQPTTKRASCGKKMKQLQTIIHGELSPDDQCKKEARVVSTSNVHHENLLGCEEEEEEEEEGIKRERSKDEYNYQKNELINCGGGGGVGFRSELDEFDDFFRDLSDLQFLPWASSRIDAAGSPSPLFSSQVDQ